jgi:AraC-like DNA-binding protein
MATPAGRNAQKAAVRFAAQRTGEPDPKRKSLCAAVAGMSPHYFAELFKRSTGRLLSGMFFYRE